MKARRLLTAAAIAGAGLWLAASLHAGARLDSATEAVTRSALPAGGEESSSAGHRLQAAAGEETSPSTATSPGHVLSPGAYHLFSFPGAVTDLSAGRVFASSVALQWSAPGADGDRGQLQPGTSYWIRVASYTVPDTFSREAAELAVSTAGTWPGARVSTNAVGLLPNTTYFAQLWTLDRLGNVSYASNRSTHATLAPAPVALPAADTFLAAFVTSVTVNWAALPSSPPDASSKTAEGYRLEASSTDFSGGLVHSSVTYNVLASTLTVLDPPLDSNKVYYFRVASLNWASEPNYTHLGSTRTSRAAIVPALTAPTYPAISSYSATAAWDANGNGDWTIFTVEASTAADFTGDADLTSTTFNTSFDLLRLARNTTYYFRVSATTESSTSLPLDLGSTSTLAAQPLYVAEPLADLAFSSMTARWLPGDNPVDVTTYTVAFTTGAMPNAHEANVIFTTKPAGALPTATVTGLAGNTTYNVYVAALNWNGSPGLYTFLGTTVTFAGTPEPAAPAFAGVGYSSATVFWSRAGNAVDVTSYTVVLSTSPSIDETDPANVSVSTTPQGPQPSATVSGLSAAATYYLFARAFNHAGVPTPYAAAGSTATRSALPGVAVDTFTGIAAAGLTLNWSAGSAETGFNAAGTTYYVQLGTGSGAFYPVIAQSRTVGLSSGVVSLLPNATYQLRAAAYEAHHGTWTAFTYFGATATLAAVPVVAASPFWAVHRTSMSVAWGRNGNPVSVTTYTVALTPELPYPNSNPLNVELTTAPVGASPAATLAGLAPNTTYYLFARGVNFNSMPSAWAQLASTSTLAVPPAGAVVSAVYRSSAVFAWDAGAAAGWRVRASSTNFAAGTAVFQSSTPSPGATSLTVFGLDQNTTHYFRVGALNWNNIATEVEVSSASTLARSPTGPGFKGVFETSATLTWHSLPAPPPSSGTAQGYVLQAATASLTGVSDWGGEILSSVTYNVALSTLTVLDLQPGTTYAFRIGTLNFQDAPDFVAAGSSRTKVTPLSWDGGGGDNRWFTATNWNPNAIPGPGSPVTVDIAATVNVAGTDPPISFSSMTLGSPTGGVAVTINLATTVAGGGAVLMRKGATLSQQTTHWLVFDGDFEMRSGSLLTHPAVAGDPENSAVRIRVSGLFDLQEGATIAVDGLGFPGGAANGFDGVIIAGGGGNGDANSSGGGGGGGHGGAGGEAGALALGGVANDSEADPVRAGSGGGGGDVTGAGGRGGGLVALEAQTLSLNGRITADGAQGAAGGGGFTLRGAGGGGAGGTVNLRSSYFVGGGTVSAVGGQGGTDTDNGNDPGGGGGGGRVSVRVTGSGNVCELKVSTTGGATGGGTSQAGFGGTFSSTQTLAVPALSGVYATTASVHWTWTAAAGGLQYRLFSSTGGAGQSPVLGAATTFYTEAGLLANTTYSRYVQVAACGSSSNSAVVDFATLSGTATASSPAFPAVSYNLMTAAWQPMPGSPQEASARGFRLELSTRADFQPGTVLSSATANGLSTELTVLDLLPNTTYYGRVASLNWAGSLSSYAALGSTSTLALSPGARPDPFAAYHTSASARYYILPVSPPAASSSAAEGYLVQASETDSFAAVTASATLSRTLDTLVPSPLKPNTTYYFRTASLNWAGAASSFTVLGSTITLPDAPTALVPPFLAAYPSSVTVQWAALPASPPEASASGYRLEASSKDFAGGQTLQTQTFDLAQSTLSMQQLMPNTTYYFRVASLNAGGSANYTALSSTPTLAPAPVPLPSNQTFLASFVTSVTVNWAALPLAPPDASSKTAEGFLLEASSTNFTSGVIHSSRTYNVLCSTLTVMDPPLDSNKFYSFRVASLNWSDAPHYTHLGSTKTSRAAIQPAPAAAAYPAVSSHSVTAAWDANGNGDWTIFTVEASTASDFTGDADLTSTTFNTSFELFRLLTNTTYYFQVKATTEASTSLWLDLASTSTLAGFPAAAAPPFPWVGVSSMAANWLPGGNPVNVTSYTLALSTSSGFPNAHAGNVYVATAPAGGLLSATPTGLAANTSYFVFADALNWGGASSGFTLLGSTATHAAPPAAAALPFPGVFGSSLTAAWSRNGNAVDVTTYTVILSTAPALDEGDPTNVSLATAPAGLSPTATFTGLAADATYYLFARAVGHASGATAYVSFGSTATRAAAPAFSADAGSFTAVTEAGFTLNWSSGTGATGYNAPGTTYYVQLATGMGAFFPVIRQSFEVSLSSVIGSLSPNTTYQLRAAAYEAHRGTWTAFTLFGATATLGAVPTAAAVPYWAVHRTSASVAWQRNGSPVGVTTYTVVLTPELPFPNENPSNATLSTAPAGASPAATVPGLLPNTTYTLFARSVNFNGLPSAWLQSAATSTLALPPAAPVVSAVHRSSVTLSWASGDAAGWRLRASSTNFSAGTAVFQSSTPAPGATSLSVFGLDENTTHYFRVGAFNWNSIPTEVEASSASTLARPATGALLKGVFETSVTVNWVRLPNPPPSSGTAQGYVLQATTADALGLADWGGEIVSSTTYNLALSTLTVLDLQPGTTYAFRIGTLNFQSAPDFIAAGSTRTRVTPLSWDGGGGDDRWFTAANWNPNAIPTEGSPLTIAAAANVRVDPTDPAVRFSSLTIGVPAGGVAVSVTLSTVIAKGRSILVHRDAGLTLGTTRPFILTEDLILMPGSTLSHRANGLSPHNFAVNLQVGGTFDLRAGATVAVAGLGFDGGAAGGLPGVINGGGGGNGSGASSAGGSGAGHGGSGGGAGSNAGGITYDSATGPALPGSGGGSGDGGTSVGGRGGGVVFIDAQTLTLDGLIWADGTDGTGSAGGTTVGAGGGGSGGAVYLRAVNLTGAGGVSAVGGAGGADADDLNDPGGGGGGGRVSIDISGSGNLCSIAVSTAGGAKGGGNSGSGLGGTLSSTVTLSVPVLTAVYGTTDSIHWNWPAVTGAVSYRIYSSTGGDGQSPALAGSATSYTEGSLLPNTTYTREVDVFACGASSASAQVSFATLASTVTASTAPFVSVAHNFIQVQWNAFPSAPLEAASEGFVLEASTRSDYQAGTTASSASASGLAASLKVLNLMPNTTYYFRAASRNHAGALSPYTELGSTSTLALPVSALSESFLGVFFTSVTAQWAAAASAPPDASSMSAQGYVLEASTTNFGALTPGGVVYSSRTTSVMLSTLTVGALTPLDACSLTYFRVGALNWSGVPNYTVLGSTRNFDYGVVVSTHDLDVGGINVDTEIVISTSLLVSNVACPVTYAIRATTITAGSPWTIAASSGVDTFTVRALFSAGQPALGEFDAQDALSDAPTAATPTRFSADQSGAAVPAGEDRLLWFRLGMPRITSTESSQQIRVYVTATPP